MLQEPLVRWWYVNFLSIKRPDTRLLIQPRSTAYTSLGERQHFEIKKEEATDEAITAIDLCGLPSCIFAFDGFRECRDGSCGICAKASTVFATRTGKTD
jgi:hypothetical protein